MIMITCESCDIGTVHNKKEFEAALRANDVTLHLLTSSEIQIQEKTEAETEKTSAKVYGYDSNKVFQQSGTHNINLEIIFRYS